MVRPPPGSPAPGSTPAQPRHPARRGHPLAAFDAARRCSTLIAAPQPAPPRLDTRALEPQSPGGPLLHAPLRVASCLIPFARCVHHPTGRRRTWRSFASSALCGGCTSRPRCRHWPTDNSDGDADACAPDAKHAVPCVSRQGTRSFHSLQFHCSCSTYFTLESPTGASTSSLHSFQPVGKCLHFAGPRLRRSRSYGLQWRAQWLENTAEVDVPVNVEHCFSLWEDREQIPKWMPWISTVKVGCANIHTLAANV